MADVKSLSVDPEIECLRLKKAINDNHRLAQKYAADAVERAILTGELLGKWKELLPHGKFEKFVATHFEGSARTARSYMLAAQRLSGLDQKGGNRQNSADLEHGITGLLESLKPQSDSVAAGREARTSEGTPRAPEGGSNPPATTKSISVKGKPGGESSSSSREVPASSGPASGEAADSNGSLGKCPNCGGTKWKHDGFGHVCAKCSQPHGEPSGNADEDKVGIQRSKTVKTAEALMRAFDDLNRMVKKPNEHTEAIASCKFLLKTARAWK